MRLNPSALGDVGALSRHEWLETNGLGGFASSTVAGLNTRRYHGLLVAALRPPVGRFVLLSKLDETLIVDGRRHELSTNQYPGAVHPVGYRYLSAFRLDPFPVFTYDVEGVTVERSIWMIHGRNATVVEYTFAGLPADVEVRLELRPLIAGREFHGLTHENGALDPSVALAYGRATVTPYEGVPPLSLTHDADEVLTEGYWYRRFEYPAEEERGLDHTEDLFNPLTLVYRLAGRAGTAVVASADLAGPVDIPRLRRDELARRARVVAAVPVDAPATRALAAAADQFLAARGDGQTVIAGYHWFSDWGRDTMIARPGLTLATGRHDVARDILMAFATHLDQGLIPNRFPDAGEAPEYNTVDGALWFIDAVRAFVAASGDHAFVRTRIYPAHVDIIDWHERGTHYGIRADTDGLLLAGDAGTQLTWMDAKIGDWAVTPRHGKPVEIQALWYNALRTVESFARTYGDDKVAQRLRRMAMRVRRHFTPAFWNGDAGCLYDVVNGDARDASVRPNQIIAVSLQFTMLTPSRSRSVVRVVERDLLTPYGLRTLAPADPRYEGRYEGDGPTRDARYHQGAAWPWLMGPFVTAYLKVHLRSATALRQADVWLGPLRNHLVEAGLGQVSELFDGDPPHTPRGCIAQAWSVAEMLRATVECREGAPANARMADGLRRAARPRGTRR